MWHKLYGTYYADNIVFHLSSADQSGASKPKKKEEEGEGVITTTVIGKPDWGEADKTSEKPSKEGKTETEQDRDGESKDTTREGREKDNSDNI